MHRYGPIVATLVALGGMAWPAPSVVRAQDEVEQLRSRVKQLETDVAALRERLVRLEGERSPRPKGELVITVLPGEWGCSAADLTAVCRSAATELTRSMREPNTDPISLRRDAQQGPMVIYGKGDDGERRVLLNSGDRLWAQVAFQFAHEVCHIQCNYRDKEKSNLWFEESLCEAASLFVLRRMAETWKTKPPYANWKSYAPSLHDYADKRIVDIDKPADMSTAEWFRRHEAELRSTGTNRRHNQIVAVALLPLLEKKPENWQAVRYLNLGDPQAKLSFPQFLREWHGRVPAEQREFVEAVGAVFEIAVK